MSLRGAQRRGNLYQTIETQAEGPLRRQEVAAPFGLAMTSVLLGGFGGPTRNSLPVGIYLVTDSCYRSTCLFYSYLKASTGRAAAARLACSAIVSHATANAAKALATNNQAQSASGALYTKRFSH